MQQTESHARRWKVQRFGHIHERVRPLSIVRRNPASRVTVESLCFGSGDAVPEREKIPDRLDENGHCEAHLARRLVASAPQITELLGANAPWRLQQRASI
jgi:hypothetical protein